MKKKDLKSNQTKLHELFKLKFSGLHFISVDKNQDLDIRKRGARYQAIVRKKNNNLD